MKQASVLITLSVKPFLPPIASTPTQDTFSSLSVPVTTAAITSSPYCTTAIIPPASSSPTASLSGSKPYSAVTLTNTASAITDRLRVSPSIASFNGSKLLTGTCTSPIALITPGPEGRVWEYPWIGCSEIHQDCCPFNIHARMYLSRCPQDYTTTRSSCCPSGWKIYSEQIGGQTSCYTTASVLLITAPRSETTNTIAFTDLMFSMRYELYSALTAQRLDHSTLIGIIVGSIAGVCILSGAAFLFWRRRKRPRSRDSSEPSPATQLPDNPIHELQATDNPRIRLYATNEFLMTSIKTLGYPNSLRTTASSSNLPRYNSRVPIHDVAELPGSTLVNEYHPAFRSDPAIPMSLDRFQRPCRIVSNKAVQIA
ncbi:hypothetical protein AJ80_07043 [Polytolypa hystricis UAMH7299]|uniref:Uncharacterized protein n=1 Tax=Polytolypa hystricis (strain UAMH7299) TaxID=1447883 RepID=A0A2B7XRU8_POLH7|nr:hypothetical protein AJ80_07043 [Polytolypa hystricis UAMH7299]